MDRRFHDLDIRRDFTELQIVPLSEIVPSLIVIEHNLLLFSLEPTFLKDMTRNADSVIHFDEVPRSTTKLFRKLFKSAEEPEDWGLDMIKI